MRRWAPLVVVLLVALPGRADFQAALDAYNAGDFETAYHEWLLVAEEGSAPAQFNIGRMFERGEGREPDIHVAVVWYTRSAESGFARAQFRLGELYEADEAIEQDLVKARKWFSIAAQSKYPGAKKRKKRITGRMTPKEIALGDMYAREYRDGKKK